MTQVLSNSWTCIYIPNINSVIACLFDQGMGDYLYLTLMLGGIFTGVFVWRLFLEDSQSFDETGSI